MNELLVSFMNMYSILHAFVISVNRLLSCVTIAFIILLYDLFSCQAASVFIINLLTYLLTIHHHSLPVYITIHLYHPSNFLNCGCCALRCVW